jgi:outer membrane receptor protein involved in Fe transport
VNRRRRAACAAAALALAAALPAGAQSGCGPRAAAPAPAGGWAPPLDRSVSLHAGDVSLRSALDRLAAASRVRFSYSADLLPLDRRVCASGDAVPVGQALAELLHGTGVAAVVAGPDQVVLAPSREPAAAGAAGAEPVQTVALDRIVVTGTPNGGSQRALPYALDVLDGGVLERRGTGRLAQELNGAVPGIWAWESSPASVLTRYGSIRGASSFGVSYPKVYIDGIEVANPLLVSQLAPETVERVEVIRGPQGAALYGTDAISGVVNIVTRHEGSDQGAARVRVRSGVGLSDSEFSPGSPLAQDHALTLRAGSPTRSAGLSVAGRSVGEFIPDAYSRSVAALGSARLVGARSITTGIARFSAERAGVSASPLLPADTGAAGPAAVAGRQSVRQYTLGMSSVFVQDDRWTHSLTAGVDGNRLAGVPDGRAPFGFADAPGVRTGDGGADRGTFRAGSVARFGEGGELSGGIALAAEHSALREVTYPDASQPVAGGSGGPGSTPAPGGAPASGSTAPAAPAAAQVEWRHSSAVLAQGHASLRESLWLTAGLRLERNEGLTGRGQGAALPMLGASWVGGRGDATLKLRGAYGKGIRPLRTAAREASWPGFHAHSADGDLAPEEQSGVEVGADVLLGRGLALHLTRFDQLASGLIQRVPFEQAPSGVYGVRRDARMEPRRIGYRLENVGEITNRGWEAQASAELGPLALDGSFSRVDSRVRRVAGGYTGELRPGDRMLEVPARTASLTASWLGGGWAGSVTAYRAWDWINYDYLALARDSADASHPSQELVGAKLRTYWREYPGITHLRATAARDVRPGLSLVLSGDNLLGRQLGEPDNVTVLPGRTLTFGLRAEF